MGANTSISNNIASQITNSGNRIASSYVQNCRGTVKQNQNLNFTNCTLNGDTFDFNQSELIDINCIQNSTTQATMINDIFSQMNSQAQAVAQNFGVGFDTTISSNINSIVNNLSRAIRTAHTQTCLGGVDVGQTLNCNNSTVSNTVFNFSQNTESYNNCVANNSTVAELTDQLATAISQTSTAKEADSFSAFVIIFFVVLAIVGLFLVNSLNGPLGWAIVAIIVLIALAAIFYGVFASQKGLYPFAKGTNP